MDECFCVRPRTDDRHCAHALLHIFTCESRLPRLPGLGLDCSSSSVPHFTMVTQGVPL